MKKELQKWFLSTNYKQDFYLQLHNFRQHNQTVEDYTTEFEHPKIKYDLVELEEQTIARYLEGLRSEISNVVQDILWCV